MNESEIRWGADELGPAMVAFLRPCSGVEAVVVIDNVALGPAIGGVRMRPGITAAEVARLARAMTLKNALAGLPHGGAKSGISAPGLGPSDHERVMRAFARAMKHLTDYIPGPDMGTSETSMAYIYDEIGRAVGRPAVLGGIPLDELGATAYGLAVCADVLSEQKAMELPGARVVVQGFGSVGWHIARLLAERAALVIAVSDSRGATWNPDGLDVPALRAHLLATGQVADFPGGKTVPRDDILSLDCELLVPAAQTDVVTTANVRGISAKIVLEGANVPITVQAEAQLAARGVLCVPDVIANAGGVICAAAEHRGAGPAEAFADIAEKIRGTTLEMLDRMRADKLTPRATTARMASERLRQAIALRRKF